MDSPRHGRPPLSEKALFESANFTLSILPARLAHRIQSLRNLPFIVVSNPQISRIHGNYIHSLSTLLPWAEREVKTLEDEIKFTEVMADLVQTHADTISILARGFLEARKYITAQDVTKFLDEHLRARIGTRLIAEQHIALHFSSRPHLDLSDEKEDPSRSSFIGVIDTQLSPASVIRHCEGIVADICEFKFGVRPSVVIEGDPEYTFEHVPVHLEYIMTELLKNAFRATIEKGMEREPVVITIAPLPVDDTSSRTGPKVHLSNRARENTDEAARSSSVRQKDWDLVSTGNIKPLETPTPGVTIRIRDRGGGISPENYKRIWDYSFTTFNAHEVSTAISRSSGMDALSAIAAGGGESIHSLAGLGYGLPLSRAYAEYFNGKLDIQSLWGWGTDVYLRLRGVGIPESSRCKEG